MTEVPAIAASIPSITDFFKYLSGLGKPSSLILCPFL